MTQRAHGLLLVTALWLAASPARADFFEDLSFAVNKLGNAVEDTVTEALQTDEPQRAPASPAAPQAPTEPQIIWNTVPETTTPAVGLPPMPPRRPAGATSHTAPSRSVMRHDDAPAPRAAPPRRPVSVVAALPPLPGTLAASSVVPRPAYGLAPRAARSANSNSASALQQQMTLNSIRPAAAAQPAVASVQAVRSLANAFQVRFEGQHAEVTDRATEGRLLPPSAAAPVIATAATRVKDGLNLRLTLVAYTTPPEGQSAEARRRSFTRASAVKDWLVRQGVRRTQIDMKVELAPTDSGPADRVDLVITPDL